MMHTSFKNKIYFVIFVWLIVCVVMFTYCFKIVDRSNQSLIANYAKQEHDLEQLQAQKKSYLQASDDLNRVKTQKYQPEDLFSQDTAFVNELKTLENLGEQMGVTVTISGISGTVTTAAKAHTASVLYQIPFGIFVTGSLDNCVAFLESLEHLTFVTTVTSLSVSAGAAGDVSMSVSGSFYLRPQ